MVDKSMY